MKRKSLSRLLCYSYVRTLVNAVVVRSCTSWGVVSFGSNINLQKDSPDTSSFTSHRAVNQIFLYISWLWLLTVQKYIGTQWIFRSFRLLRSKRSPAQFFSFAQRYCAYTWGFVPISVTRIRLVNCTRCPNLLSALIFSGKFARLLL